MSADNGTAARTTTTDTTGSKNAQPWGPAMPALGDAMSAAGNIFNNSSLGFGGFPGPSQAPMDYRTAGSLDSMWDLASAGNELGNNAYTNALNVISRGGYSPQSMNAIEGVSGLIPQYQDFGARAGGQQSAASGYMPRFEAGVGMDSFYNTALEQINQPTASSGMLSGPSVAQQNLSGPSVSQQNLSGPSAAKQYLGDMASGAEAQNPWLQEMLATERAKAQNSVSSSFSGSGRMGSGQHYGVMGQKMTEATAPILASAYESAKQRQLAATGQIDSQDLARSGQIDDQAFKRAGLIDSTTLGRATQLDSATGQRLGLGLSALGAMGSFRQGDNSNLLAATGQLDAQTARNYQNQLAALSGQQGAATTAAGMHDRAIDRTGQFGDRAGSLYSNLYQPYQYGQQVGAAYQQDEQARLNDAIRYWTAAQGFPQSSTNAYSTNAATMGGLGGTTNTTGHETKVGPDTSPQQWQQIAGLGMTGLGLLGKLSDRRLKRDVVKLGTAPNGLNVYQYRYLWSDDVEVGHMADEVERVMPEAVGEIAGFKTVRYELLGAL